MTFLENILHMFQVAELARFCDGQSSKENYSISRLILIDIYMKFQEDTPNSFHDKERTRFCDSGNNQKSGVMVLALFTLSNADKYLYEFVLR